MQDIFIKTLEKPFRILKHSRMMERQHKLNSLGDVTRMNQKYFKRYYHFDLNKHKLSILLNKQSFRNPTKDKGII